MHRGVKQFNDAGGWEVTSLCIIVSEKNIDDMPTKAIDFPNV